MGNRKRFTRKRKQRGGFPTTQLYTLVTENPLYSYATQTEKSHQGIDRLYAKSTAQEIPIGMQDDFDTVDSWLASIVLYGKILGDKEIKLPTFTKIIEVKNSKPINSKK